MKTSTIIVLCALILSGCATTKVVDVPCIPQVVEVPVMSPVPAPKIVTRPELMINQLTNADVNDPGKIAQYYNATIKQLSGYASELEIVIEGYRQLHEQQKGTTK